jgi:hypothetical protein
MATVDATMMKVQRILTGPMKLRIQLQGTTMYVQFNDTSTQVSLSVSDWGPTKDGEPRSLVNISSPILWSVPPSPQLFEWIAREGGRYYFGHVSAADDVRDQGKIFLSMNHTLLGDYLDEEELSAAMFAVLNTADQLDDELQKRFGGKRWADH